jgi:hypothetical protein
MFFQKILGGVIFCGHKILTEGVFITKLSSNTGISFAECVHNDKLLFNERYDCRIYCLLA